MKNTRDMTLQELNDYDESLRDERNYIWRQIDEATTVTPDQNQRLTEIFLSLNDIRSKMTDALLRGERFDDDSLTELWSHAL